jgi:hypothetical protein
MTSLEDLHRAAQGAISSVLEPSEEIALAVRGENGSALVATNRRVFVFKKGITTGAFFGKQLNSWDYSNVSGVEVKQGLTTNAIVVQVPGVEPVTKFGRMDKGHHSVWEAPNAIMVQRADIQEPVATLRRLIADHQRGMHGGNVISQDPIEQVKRLAELRDQGLLTEEEFQTKKKQLLGL